MGGPTHAVRQHGAGLVKIRALLAKTAGQPDQHRAPLRVLGGQQPLQLGVAGVFLGQRGLHHRRQLVGPAAVKRQHLPRGQRIDPPRRRRLRRGGRLGERDHGRRRTSTHPARVPPPAATRAPIAPSTTCGALPSGPGLVTRGQVQVIADAAHGLFVNQADVVTRLLREFFAQHDNQHPKSH